LFISARNTPTRAGLLPMNKAGRNLGILHPFGKTREVWFIISQVSHRFAMIAS
jgi:hypothetical protein